MLTISRIPDKLRMLCIQMLSEKTHKQDVLESRVTPMPIEITTVISPLNKLLDYFQSERQFRTNTENKQLETNKKALESIHLAIVETRKYVESLPESKNRDQEHKLSELWGTAAIEIKLFLEADREFNEAADKALYWAKELKVPNYVLIEKGIDLETVEKKFYGLLK